MSKKEHKDGLGFDIIGEGLKRYLYRFKLTARLRRFLEEQRGHEVAINRELVRKDGLLLTLLPRSTRSINLVSCYLVWPDAKVVWAVYVKEDKDIGT